MIAIVLGLFIVGTTLSVYIAQTQTYTTSLAQGSIQTAESVITNFVVPYIRSAGYAGCSSMKVAMSNLNSGGPPPLGTLNSTGAMLAGYEATTNLTQMNAANSTNGNNWSPQLHSSLTGLTEAGSDVIVVLGGQPFAQPIGVTTFLANSNSFSVQTTSGITAGQFGVISDCAKATVFYITSVSGSSISHTAGSGALTNASNAFPISYSSGAQFLPVSQNAFFVAQGLGGQSSLMMATLNGSTWSVSPIVPGVDMMQILYGIGTNNQITQYVTAQSVTDWSAVYAIRLGFLLEGGAASGGAQSTNQTQFNILGSTVTVPADSRLRHVFELTITLRNGLT